MTTGSIVNRTTRQFIPSANLDSYSSSEWIFNPDLSAVTGFDEKYWKISGDVVSLMTQQERDAVDAAETSSMRDRMADTISAPDTYLRAFALVVLDEINLLRANAGLPTRTAAQLKTAVRNKMDT